MRVGLDVTSFAFGVHAGVAVYLRRLAEALLAADPALELVLLYQQRRTPDADAMIEELRGPRVAVRFGGLATTRLPARGGTWLPWHPGPRRLVGPVDVYHAGDGAMPARDGTPIVSTVHDLTTHLFPDHHTALNRRHDRRRLRWLARAADHVLADSEATARDLVRFYPALAGRVSVVVLASGAVAPPPAEARAARLAALRATHGLGDAPYVLSVGTLEPRKNHVALVRAFDAVAAAHPTARLVLAGRAGWKSEPILAAIAASPARARIHALGGVSADDLAALYGGAAAFAYPSLYEGFGLPVLEAMAAGAPVVTSNASSIPEVAGDAALLVDPARPDAIRDALLRVLGDAPFARDLAARGRARAGTFTWERTAADTLARYRAAIAAVRGRG